MINWHPIPPQIEKQNNMGKRFKVRRLPHIC